MGFSDGDNPIITTAVKAADGKRRGTTVVRETVMPNYYSMLPEEIRKHTVGGNYDPLNPQESLISGAAGGHHGSHPHLVHEFVSSILENRKAAIDEVLGGEYYGCRDLCPFVGYAGWSGGCCAGV